MKPASIRLIESEIAKLPKHPTINQLIDMVDSLRKRLIIKPEYLHGREDDAWSSFLCAIMMDESPIIAAIAHLGNADLMERSQ
jgi:hypothetical protein